MPELCAIQCFIGKVKRDGSLFVLLIGKHLWKPVIPRHRQDNIKMDVVAKLVLRSK